MTLRDQWQAVWGMELAEPFDNACAETAFVGRAWMGSGLSEPDPSFTAEALNAMFGGASHDTLADDYSRIVQLDCNAGSTPVVAVRRMTDTGVRSFGPVGAVALVKDNFVVFFNPVWILNADLTQSFFATPADGGSVVVSEVDGEDRVLLPNPYGPDDIRIEITVERDLDAGADAGMAGLTVAAPNLLYLGPSPRGVLAGTGVDCGLRSIFLFAFFGPGFTEEAADLLFWSSDYSVGGFGSYDTYDFGDGVRTTIEHPDDVTETITLGEDESVRFVIEDGDGTCDGTGTYTTNGGLGGLFFPFEGGGDAGGDDEEPDTGEDADSSTSEPDGGETEGGEDSETSTDGTGGGVPWVPVGVGILVPGGGCHRGDPDPVQIEEL